MEHIFKETHIQGVKVEFRCKKGVYRLNECPAMVQLLYHSESLAVSLFKTDAEHQHDGISNSRGLNSDLKEFIENKFRDGIEKPNAILALIKKANLEEPPKS